MSKDKLKNDFCIHPLTPIPKDIDPNYINLTLLQKEFDSNKIFITSSLKTKDHLVLAQSTTSNAISDPYASFLDRTNPMLTLSHSRRSSTGEITQKKRHQVPPPVYRQPSRHHHTISHQQYGHICAQ